MANVLRDVVKVEVCKDYFLYLEFEDGCSGIVDIAKLISFTGIFEPLKDKNYFKRVVVNSEIGTVCWPNGADISPSYLYASVNTKAVA